jgi:hypothetical protein
MKTLVLLAVLTLASLASGATCPYRITDARRVVSDKCGYSFSVPPGWYISASNPAPYLFNFSPKYLQGPSIGPPDGGADIGVVADSHDVGTIDRWIEIEQKVEGATIVKTLELPAATGITRAVEATWSESIGGLTQTAPVVTIAVYFVFRGQAFAAYLSFNGDDKASSQYIETLMTLLKSFCPVGRAAKATHGTRPK